MSKSIIIFDKKYSNVQQENILKMSPDVHKSSSRSTSNNEKIKVDILDNILVEYNHLKNYYKI